MKPHRAILIAAAFPLLFLLATTGCGGRSSTPQAPAEGDVAAFLAENPEFAEAPEDNEEQLNADE